MFGVRATRVFTWIFLRRASFSLKTFRKIKLRDEEEATTILMNEIVNYNVRWENDGVCILFKRKEAAFELIEYFTSADCIMLQVFSFSRVHNLC